MSASRWWPFLGLVFLLGIFTHVHILAAFAVMLAAISLLADWWNRRALQGVVFQRKLDYTRGYPGESLDLQVEVENRKFLPIPWLRIQDNVPLAVAPQDETLLQTTHMAEIGALTSLFSLRWYERDRRKYSLLLRKRGVYQLGPPRLESGDIFGFFEQVEDDGPRDYVTVLPQSVPFQTLRLPTGDPFGHQRTRRRLYEDPNQPMGVREYLPEDDFRRIHWPATAHAGNLQVKVYQPVSARVMVICLNVLTLPHYWEGTDPELLEYLVQVTATLVERGLQGGYQVGLASNGSLSHAGQPFRVPPGRSPAQLAHLLTALASVTPFVIGSFDHFLLAEAPRLPYGATLVIVTALTDPAIMESILRLKKRGRRIFLLSFARQAPPSIPGVSVLHRPFRG